jgi:UPF0716 protein FxsA
MAGRLLLLFLLVPAAEIAVLVAVGDRVGLLPTLGLVVFAAVAGSFLARREGLAVWRRVQARLAQGGVPGPELVDGLIVFAASVLLLTPGFLSDVAGLLGLFPPTRALVRRFAMRQFEKRVADGRLRVSPLAPMGSSAAHVRVHPEAVEDAEVIDDGRRPGAAPGRRPIR